MFVVLAWPGNGLGEYTNQFTNHYSSKLAVLAWPVSGLGEYFTNYRGVSFYSDQSNQRGSAFTATKHWHAVSARVAASVTVRASEGIVEARPIALGRQRIMTTAESAWRLNVYTDVSLHMSLICSKDPSYPELSSSIRSNQSYTTI